MPRKKVSDSQELVSDTPKPLSRFLIIYEEGLSLRSPALPAIADTAP
jgi:hypothetical protein